MKTYSTIISRIAKNDLIEIWSYVAENDLVGKADILAEKLEDSCQKLSHFPERGRLVQEMEILGINDFREIHCNPYRIIYEILNDTVVIYGILDSRRNLGQLLQKRLLDYQRINA